jgi:predicted Zn-dependent protease
MRALLDGLRARGRVKTFVVNASFKEESSSVLLLGLRHTKAPEQTERRFEASIYLETPTGDAVSLDVCSADMALLASRLERALSLASPLAFKPSPRRHAGYPHVPLASEELRALLASGRAAEEAARLALAIEERAREVTHPRLMSREAHATVSGFERFYFDSEGNEAKEEAAYCSLQCVFWTRDTSEDASDVVGSLPAEAEVDALVHDAARNLTVTSVRKLEPKEGARVLLTPKAFLSLLDDLVLPNLEARTLLRKTGSFEMEHIDQRVLGSLSLSDDPHLPYSPFSSCYDTDGTPTRPVTIVENGILRHPLFSAALLAELEAEHPALAGRFALTGHAVSLDRTSHTNLDVRLEGLPEIDFARAVAAAPQVVVVGNLTGMSADPLTGQFALDADGARVHENGALAYTTSLTLRGNIMEVLRDGHAALLPRERAFNRRAPGILTSTLACVPKELAEEFEG